MIIESQDKMEIFNFDEIFRLYVDNWSNEEFATEPNCFCIKAEKSSDNMICALRCKAYGWLAEQLHISREYTHIGMFEKEECEETIRLSKIRIEKYKKQRSEIFEWI